MQINFIMNPFLCIAHALSLTCIDAHRSQTSNDRDEEPSTDSDRASGTVVSQQSV